MTAVAATQMRAMRRAHLQSTLCSLSGGIGAFSESANRYIKVRPVGGSVLVQRR